MDKPGTPWTDTPQKYVFGVISIGQRGSSPWPCNSVKVKIKLFIECKFHFPCAQLMF